MSDTSDTTRTSDPPDASDAIIWQLSTFEELTTDELYELLRLRQIVFVVEQACAYLDADGHDREAWHLLGWRAASGTITRELVTCARLFAPGAKYREAAIGRVVTHPGARGIGLGRALMHEAIGCAGELFGEVPIRISAQRYLERFYGELGFVIDGEPYDEDGIPHVEMLRR